MENKVLELVVDVELCKKFQIVSESSFWNEIRKLSTPSIINELTLIATVSKVHIADIIKNHLMLRNYPPNKVPLNEVRSRQGNSE